MQPTLEQWLERGAKKKVPYSKPSIRTAKRSKEERVYRARVKVWLTRPENRFCRIWLAKRGLDWTAVDELGRATWMDDGVKVSMACPRATECHHMDSRNGARLLDESKWCPASHWEHAWVKENQSDARRIGVLI